MYSGDQGEGVDDIDFLGEEPEGVYRERSLSASMISVFQCNAVGSLPTGVEHSNWCHV